MSRYFWFFNLWWEIWLILCCTNKVLGYPKNLHLLSQYIGSLFLKDHIHHFLYNQLQPDLEIFGIDIDINLCPDISLTLHIQIYYSASTVYHAPSDLLGIGGMHHEYIRAAPNWQKKRNALIQLCVCWTRSRKWGISVIRHCAGTNVFHFPAWWHLIFLCTCTLVWDLWWSSLPGNRYVESKARFWSATATGLFCNLYRFHSSSCSPSCIWEKFYTRKITILPISLCLSIILCK